MLIGEHHWPMRETYLAWNSSKACPYAFWEWGGDALYERKYYQRKQQEKLLQQGFLVDDPMRGMLTPWIEGPLCRFLGLRAAIPAMFSLGTLQRWPPCAGDVFRRRMGVFLQKGRPS